MPTSEVVLSIPIRNDPVSHVHVSSAVTQDNLTGVHIDHLQMNCH